MSRYIFEVHGRRYFSSLPSTHLRGLHLDLISKSSKISIVVFGTNNRVTAIVGYKERHKCYNRNSAMGGRVGYGYHHWFSMVGEDEINSKYKSMMTPGRQGFLFEFRTRFILKTRVEEGVADPILDSETFDAHVYSEEDKRMESTCLYLMAYYRLWEYWMTPKESTLLVNSALDFANEKAAEPEHASLDLIPVVVHLDVYTVQQVAESFAAVVDRAIRAQNLVPLHLWPQPTAAGPEPMGALLLNFLKDLDRIRVGDIDEGLALMPVCDICKRKPGIGAQISVLPCNHAFHSLCIVRWLEGTNLCPLCDIPAYPESFAHCPPSVGSGFPS